MLGHSKELSTFHTFNTIFKLPIQLQSSKYSSDEVQSLVYNLSYKPYKEKIFHSYLATSILPRIYILPKQEATKATGVLEL